MCTYGYLLNNNCKVCVALRCRHEENTGYHARDRYCLAVSLETFAAMSKKMTPATKDRSDYESCDVDVSSASQTRA
jgi:hypothetical protein